MTIDDQAFDLTDLVDGILAGPEIDAWLAAHPDAAAEVALARQVRALVAELRARPVQIPADFEARILARARQDTSLRYLLDLTLSGIGRTLLELLLMCFELLPVPLPDATSPPPARGAYELPGRS